MKPIRIVALSAVLALGTFATALYTSSCSKDACKGVTCKNSGVCDGGNCKCPSGIGGTNCETVYRNLYAYTYKGNGTDNTGGVYTSWKLVYTTGSDTSDYTKMSMQIVDSTNVTQITVPIVLSNNTASGSVFNVTSTTTSDTFTYTGSGTISGNIASLSLTERHPRLG